MLLMYIMQFQITICTPARHIFFCTYTCQCRDFFLHHQSCSISDGFATSLKQWYLGRLELLYKGPWPSPGNPSPLTFIKGGKIKLCCHAQGPKREKKHHLSTVSILAFAANN